MIPTITIPDGIISSERLRQLLDDERSPYLLVRLDPNMDIEITQQEFVRITTLMKDCDARLAYSDFRLLTPDGIVTAECNDYQRGSFREDFDFGPAVVILRSTFLSCLIGDIYDGMRYDYAGWYAMRFVALNHLPLHISEPLYTAIPTTVTDDSERKHFSYVDPRNRAVQAEMEQVATRYLHNIVAVAFNPPQRIDSTESFPVEASVIIPVRNRVDTIGDAIFSALDQQTDFPFNVIVVDNHSTDGTTEVIRRLSEDPRLIHIIPESNILGIGGCWNLAMSHPSCGRYSIQLDSDDIYSSTDTVQRMVDCFRRERCAMVVGSYMLTDFNMNPIPPGVIDHREWTDSNGRNNLLRVNGMGAPRAYLTEIARRYPMPNVSYGEDYAMALRLSRDYHIGRIYDVLYLCRRWPGNSDASLSREKANRYNHYKDFLRTTELQIRVNINYEGEE